MKTLLITIVISILTLSGCFSTPTDDNNEQMELHLIWEYAYDPDGGAPRVKPLLHSNMVITSGDINTTALDYQTGEVIWKTPFDHHRQLLNSRFGLNDNILTGSIVRTIIAWDINSGEELWSIPIDDSLSFNNSRGIGVIPGGFIAVSNGSYVYKLNLNGEINFVNTDARSYEMTYLESVLYVGQVQNMEGVVSAYEVENFELLWRFNPGGFAYPAFTAPILEGGIVYIGTTTGPTGSKNGFFALDASTGEELWRREGIFTYSAVLVDDFIYIHDASGVYKLNKSDGSIEWYSDFNAGNGTAPIDYGYGYIYAPHSGTMHIVDAESGEIVHRLSPPDGSFFWRVTAGAGRIFAQSSRHLYAFAPWGFEEALE